MGKGERSIETAETKEIFTEREEEFDYILRPRLVSFLYAMTMPAVAAFLPAVVCVAAPEFFHMLGFNPSAGLLAAAAGVFAVLNILAQELRRRSTVLMLHIDYLVYKKGIFFTSTLKIYLQDIKNIRVVRNITDKAFNMGSLAIATSGTGGYEITLRGFPCPDKIVKYLSDHIKEGE